MRVCVWVWAHDQLACVYGITCLHMLLFQVASHACICFYSKCPGESSSDVVTKNVRQEDLVGEHDMTLTT